MSSLKISSSRSSSTQSMESRKSEPVVATASLTPVVQLTSRTRKAMLNTTNRKSSPSTSFHVRKDDGLSSPLPGTKEILRSNAMPARKASSVQSFSKSDSSIKRTRSAQNIARANSIAVHPDTSNVSKLEIGKRASSSHNVSNKGRQRLSAPVSAMAYNAGLLASFEKEKKQLERRISELIQTGEMRKTENEKLKFELRNYKERVPHENVFEELDLLRKENQFMREQLLAANISLEHFTDSEKLLILQSQNNQLQETLNTRATSDSDLNSKDLESVEDSSCIIAELHQSSLSLDANWDKQSSKGSEGGQSEVASLQDRILQMEETHYSTNEELQATLQELSDLQDTVNELSAENELLADEKFYLLESLCSQTEKLENARRQIEQLKVLLVCGSKSEERSQFESQLVALLESAEEEKEELLLKQVRLSNAVQTLENDYHELQDIVIAMKDKSEIDDAKMEGLIGEKKAAESQLCGLKEQTMKDTLDIQHLKALLENEKVKVAELELERNVTSTSDVEAHLDGRRQEKDRLEDTLVNEEQELSVKLTEIAKLKEMLEITKMEFKSLRDSAEIRELDLESQLKASESEKMELRSELDAVRENNDQLQISCDQFIEERTTYTMAIARTESELRIARSKISRLEAELKEKMEQFAEERDNWKQFQSDLQMAVVIANDLKTETQEGMTKILADKEMLREQNVSLRQEIKSAMMEVEHLKQELQHRRTVEPTIPNIDSLGLRGKVLSSVDRELAIRRQGRLLNDSKGLVPSLSVKHLISTIEEQVKNETHSPSASVCNPVLLRHDSTDGAKALGDAKSSDLPSQITTQRQLSCPSNESSLKSVIRRTNNDSKEARMPVHRHTISNIILENVTVTDDDKQAVADSAKAPSVNAGDSATDAIRKPRAGILLNKNLPKRKPLSGVGDIDRSPEKPSSHLSGHLAKLDPLALLAKQFSCSKRNALLRWCQNKTATYAGIDITNFSSSWNDGLAFCALLHTFLPDMIPYKELNSQDKVRNFGLVFKAADSVGITNTLNLPEILATERPDWQSIMSYVTNIYRHFEVDHRSS